MYDTKVDLLTKKITEQKLNNKSQTEKLSESRNFLNISNNQIKSLKSQLELKTEELFNFKGDFVQLHDLQTKKIIELQNNFKPRNSSKSTSKLDEEIKTLMKKLNLTSVNWLENEK